MRKSRTGVFLILPGVIALFILFVYPGIYNLWLSFHIYNPTISAEAEFIGLTNYAEVLSSSGFQISLTNTLVFTGGSVVLEVIFGLSFALLLSGMSRGQKLATTLLIVTMTLPDVVCVLGWRFILVPQIGILNYLTGLGIPWLSDRTFAMLSVILVDTWRTIPFVMIILLAGIFSIPRELGESIKIDGASRWHEFRYVTFPWLIPFFILVLSVRTIDAFTRVFGVVFLLTGGGPGMATEVLPLSIYRSALVTWEWGTAGTLSMIVFIISLMFTAIYLKIMWKRVRIK